MKMLTFASTLPLLGAAAQLQAAQPPNIVYVFPDQLRNCALEFWNEPTFSTHVGFRADPTHTPYLNAFAHEAVVLSHAQSNCPVSSPHRGMLLTGMYPDGSGVPLNCNSTRPCSSLRPDAICLSDVLAANGYQCAYFGKLHVDFPTPNDPERPGHYVNDNTPEWDAYTPPERRHGFNYWYSYGTFDEHKNPHYWDTNGQRHTPHEYSPKHEADQVIAYLNTVRDAQKPFFIMVGMNPPHSPYRSTKDCMESDYQLYKDTPAAQLLIRPNVNPQLADKMPSAPFYFANVTGIDREFGRIVAELKRLKLADNTIIVFSSDHGETLCSHVRDPKNSPYTEAMNVPFLIRYPKKLKPRVLPLLLSTPDIMPTLLSLVGLKKQIPNSVQGTDLSRFLIKPQSKNAPQAVLYLRNLDGQKDANKQVHNYFAETRGIKTTRYTLAFRLNRQNNLKETLFFDDQTDPYQMHNLRTDEHPEIVAELCAQLAILLQQADDPWWHERILSDIIPYQKP